MVIRRLLLGSLTTVALIAPTAPAVATPQQDRAGTGRQLQQLLEAEHTAPC